MRRPTEAIAAYGRALELDPSHARAHANLANMLRDSGDSQGAVDEFRRSLALSPNQPEVWSNMLLTLSGSDTLSREAIYAEHAAYGQHFARLIPWRPRSRPPHAKGRLRVGYVSSDFRRHAVATFFQPLLAAHDTARFEIFTLRVTKTGSGQLVLTRSASCLNRRSTIERCCQAAETTSICRVTNY